MYGAVISPFAPARWRHHPKGWKWVLLNALRPPPVAIASTIPYLCEETNTADMKRSYEKPDVELLRVEEANFFCTTPPPTTTNGLTDLDGEEW